MKRIVLVLIVCLGYAGSESAANWEITEIPVPDSNSVDYLRNWTTDDYGNLYWIHSFRNCDANGNNCTTWTYTLYRYDWSTDSVSTISQPPQGIVITMHNLHSSSSGINVAWTEGSSGIYDIFFFDGDEVTQITDTPGISEVILCVSGNSVYYYYSIQVPYPSDYRYRLFHAVKRESIFLDCNTVRSFGYKLDSDLSGDCYVNFKDLALFAQEWLECIDPINPNCIHPWL